MRNCRRVMAAAIVGSIGGLGGEANASGFQVRQNSASGLGTSFAGAAAAAEDITTIFNNPAGMTRLSGHQAAVVTTAINSSIEFAGGARTGAGAPISGGQEGDAGTTHLVPAAYLFYDATPDLKFGVAITSPFGLGNDYDDDWVGRYHALSSRLKTINFNPNIAYRMTRWLSLGGGVVLQYAEARLANAINSTTIAGAPLSDGRFEVDGDDIGYGFNLGVLLEPRKDTRIGLTYRSKIEQTLEGDIDFTMPAPLAGLPAFRDSNGSASTNLPEVVTFGVYHDLSPQFALMADIQWTRWSRFDRLTIVRDDGTIVRNQPQDWDSTFFLAVGAAYKVDDRWSLRAGAAYDQTPVRDEFRTARIPDEDRYWLSIGAGYKWNDWLQLDAAYAVNFVRDASINEASATGDRLTGTYESIIHILGVQVRMRF